MDQVVLFQSAHVLDVSREDMAVITVSQAINTLGIIESANAVALSMFGYNKRDMVGKNISMIVPPPMNARHDAYLKAYLDSGRSVVSWGLAPGRMISCRCKCVRRMGLVCGCVYSREVYLAWYGTGIVVTRLFFACVLFCCVVRDTQTTLSSTRTMFGRHCSGVVFPMLLCVKPSANSFVGVIQKLFTSDQ
jgi:hypothetical protein